MLFFKLAADGVGGEVNGEVSGEVSGSILRVVIKTEYGVISPVHCKRFRVNLSPVPYTRTKLTQTLIIQLQDCHIASDFIRAGVSEGDMPLS